MRASKRDIVGIIIAVRNSRSPAPARSRLPWFLHHISILKIVVCPLRFPLQSRNNPTPFSFSLIASGTPSAPTAHALHILALLQLGLGYAADARRVEVGLLGLNAAQTAQLLVAVLLPLGNQHRVRVSVLEQPLVQLLADGFLLVVELVDVPAPLVRNLEDGPFGLVLGDVVRRHVLRVLHLVGEDEQVLLDVGEALWGWLALRGGANGGHCEVVGGSRFRGFVSGVSVYVVCVALLCIFGRRESKVAVISQWFVWKM